MKNILIVYYSWSGNTRKVAEKIHEITGGTIFEISPLADYPGEYNKVVNQAKAEIKEGFRPLLKSSPDNIDAYDRIFTGSPNWWSTIAPPVATFLSGYDFSGKIILPFCTHGGGGQGKIVNDIAKLCPDSLISGCLEIYGNGPDPTTDISGWLNSNAKLLK